MTHRNWFPISLHNDMNIFVHQNKMRGKSGANRASPAMSNAPQMTGTQVSHNAVTNGNAVAATAVAANASTQVMQQASVSPVSMSSSPAVSAPNKVISQSAPMQAITSMAQAK